MTALLLAAGLVAVRSPAAAAPAVSLLGFTSADFEILDPANERVIGHARYAVTKEDGRILLHGDARYLDGQYDFESERFDTSPGTSPILISGDHYFFLADGTPEFRTNFDLKSGLATCIDFRSQPPVRENAQLEMPPDIWMGASVMVPIREFLRRGGAGTFKMHVFSCAPSPKIFAVEVSITKIQTRSPLSRPDMVEVDFKPDFGWLNLLVAPFVPRLNAWFDPNQDWQFAGAALARFYKGPDILLAHPPAPTAPEDAARQALPR
ncbi:MAG: hypothetical protein ACYDC3_10145 [Candidatus Binataceae bacterium]